MHPLAAAVHEVSPTFCYNQDVRFAHGYLVLLGGGVFLFLGAYALGIWRQFWWATRPYLRILVCSVAGLLLPGLYSLVALLATRGYPEVLSLPLLQLSPNYVDCTFEFGARGIPPLGLGEGVALVFQSALLFLVAVAASALVGGLVSAVTALGRRWSPWGVWRLVTRGGG